MTTQAGEAGHAQSKAAGLPKEGDGAFQAKSAFSVRFPPEVQSDELEMRWKHFVQRVRIHEMLKCMKSHHERLKVLREHTDLDDMIELKEKADEEILKARIESRARRRRRKQEREEALRENRSYEGEPGDEEELEKEKKREELEIKQREILSRIDNLFLRTSEEEEEAIMQIYPPLKKILADPRYVAKCAMTMFRSRSDITEEEFEAIILLCQDATEKQALRDAFEENQNREKYLHNANEKRKMLYAFINSQFFVQFMLVTIIISIIGIFLLTFERVSISYAWPLIALDNCIIGIFLVEATFKITIYKEDYFKKPWNLLDISIIVVNFVEVSVELVTKTLALSTDINGTIYFKLLKSLRALRLLRIIKFLPNLTVIVTTIFQSMLSMGSIAVLMSLFIFVFAVTGRGLFGEDLPKYFGGLWLTFVTLFQLLTLDDWYDIMRNLPKEGDSNSGQYWIMFVYLFFYIIIENLIFLNLFVAVLVDNFQLTLAETEVRKHNAALNFSDESDVFSEMLEELDRKLKEKTEERKTGNDDGYVDPKQPEMSVTDYFPVGEQSRERKYLESVFKDLCAMDFERFLWTRRASIVHTIMDHAITARRNTWVIQDNDNEREKARFNQEFIT